MVRFTAALAGSLQRSKRLFNGRRHRRGRRTVETQVLESRCLLTPSAMFDLSIIASDLSTTQRFFGSNNPAHAPFNFIRYGEGVISALSELPNTAAAVSASGPLWFQFGSKQPDALVEAVTLSAFDNGISDGLANQIYTPDGVDDDPSGTLFLNTQPIATGSVQKLSLQTTPQLVVTSPVSAPSELRLTAAVGDDDSIYRELVAATGGSGVLPFTLSDLIFDGHWSGAPDGGWYLASGETAIPEYLVDYGDLPDPSFPTLLQNDGARHRLVNGLILGAGVTADVEGKSSQNASGDGDDGLVIPVLNPGKSATLAVTVSGGAGFLDGWIDFNRDGDFGDAGEYVVVGQAVGIGSNQVSINVPVTALVGNSYSRFRLSSTQVSSPVGLAVDGEVEDYAITIALAAPGLTGPPGTVNGLRPEISWTSVPGATSYTVSIANASTGQNPYHTTTVTTTNYVPTLNLGIGRFYVWVRANNSVGKSPWSVGQVFKVIAPTAMATIDRFQTTPTPQISWNPLPGAARYELWINDLLAGNQAIVRDSTITSTSFIPAANMPLGKYRAWVRGLAADGTAAAWSGSVDFYVAGYPTITGGNAPTFNPQPSLEWTSVPGATGFEVFMREAYTNRVVFYQKNILGQSFTPTIALEDGLYRWWALATGANGARSLWSYSADLYIGGRTSVTSPVGQVSGNRPTIEWRQSDGAIRYELWVNLIGGPGKIIYRDDLITTSFTPESDLATGTYRVWVRAISTSKASLWSAPVDFVVSVVDFHLTDSLLTLAMNPNRPELEDMVSERLKTSRIDQFEDPSDVDPSDLDEPADTSVLVPEQTVAPAILNEGDYRIANAAMFAECIDEILSGN